jgi:preprotein translocase subunit YajC
VETLLPFALILVAFYFLILRPQRARARQAEQLKARLAPGVEIMTTSGIFGTVTEILDDSVVLEVSPGTTLRITKAAVGRVLAEDAPSDGNDADPTADDTGSAPDSPALDESDADTADRRSPSGE